MHSITISVCIICFNEEQNIRRCLDSCTWVDEIIVVDSMSQDKTVTIAREYTDKVYQKVWPGYLEQKSFALSKATGVWILSLDADEEISTYLRDEILTEIRRPGAKDGYRVPRRSFYQGRWINHSGYYPDKQLRLFRSAKGRWQGGRVHEKVEIKGTVGELKSHILHYPYKGVISGQLQTVNSFSSLFAQDMYEKGERYRLSLLLLRPLFKFLEVYVLKLGFLDGLAGFVIAVTSAYAMFVRYVKLRELEKRLERKMPK
ncbi:MAG TPA: glycosyltransferase family 2 protein [Desulfatiglandales bacterium]|nr:glycosyltransferase family 2 protein [Desulfatiglandales bacterium]